MAAETNEGTHEDVAINSDMIQEDLSSLLKSKFAHEQWNPRKVDIWVDDIVESVLKNLADLKKPFKYIVNCVMMQRTGAGISTGFISLWDNTLDGVVHVPFENDSLHCLRASHTLRRYRRVGVYSGGCDILWLAEAPRYITLSDGRAGLPSSYEVRQSADGDHRFFAADGEDCCSEQVRAVETVKNFNNEDDLRLLRESGLALRNAADTEIRAEVERDCRDGVAAIPPLSPLGWKVRHPAGSNYFVMTRTLLGGAQSGDLHTRRYQSVHEAFLRAVKGEKRQHQKRKQHQEQKLGQARQGLGDVASKEFVSCAASTVKAEIGYDPQAERRAVLQRVEETSDELRGVERADVHLTVFAPFRVYDPSLHDHSVDICEWSSFDVLIRKTPSSSSVGVKGTHSSLNSLAHLVAEKELCMFVRVASVNSEMRIRSIQLLSRHEALALEEHVCFGQGEPAFLELIRHHRQASATSRPPRSVRCYDEPSTFPEETPEPKESSTTILAAESCNSASNSSYEFLVNCFNSGGEYSRSLCYGGPCVSELSKEMVEALQGYLQGDLGLSPGLCEYVCQMQFFLEQEEYTAWLGRLRHIAAVVSGRG